MISNPSASHSTLASTAAGSAGSPSTGRASLKTISGSIFGENIRASDSDADPPGASCTVSSYMCAQTSVLSFSTRQTALFAKPTLRPTVVRPLARRMRTSSASTAYAASRSKPATRPDGGSITWRPAYAAVSSAAMSFESISDIAHEPVAAGFSRPDTVRLKADATDIVATS